MIAVKDGAILWSWHIWYPEAEVAGLNSKTGYEVMNMNLGAMHNTPGDVGSYGLPLQLCTIQHLARLVAGRHEQRRPVGQSQRR